MSDLTPLDLNYFWQQLFETGIILQRPVVQIQIVGIVTAILLAWLTSRRIWFKIRQQFPEVCTVEHVESRLPWRQVLVAAIQHLLMPTLSLITISITTILFEQWGWFSGYLEDSLIVFRDFWIYRLVVSSLLAILPVNFVNQCRYRFFAPLLILYELNQVLSLFFDLKELSRIALIKLFGEQVLLASAFISISGLYFWIVGVFLIEKFLLKVLWKHDLRDPQLVQIISLLFRYFLIGLGIILIFGYVGVSSTAVAAITGGLSVGIGFGLKEVISNFISGIWLLFEGALKPGDIIKINGEISQVIKLGIRATTVRIIQDNSEEIIPNQTFFTQNVSTLTGSNKLVALSLVVGASYNCNPPKVVAVLLEVARQNTKVLTEPSPQAFAVGFGESSIDFELKYWIDKPLIFKAITSQLVCDIWQAFEDHNIEIPYPQQDLHIRSLSEITKPTLE